MAFTIRRNKNLKGLVGTVISRKEEPETGGLSEDPGERRGLAKCRGGDTREGREYGDKGPFEFLRRGDTSCCLVVRETKWGRNVLTTLVEKFSFWR